MDVMYQVYVQPLLNNTEYGVNTDISEYVRSAGMSAIYRQLDSIYDFDFGIYRFNSASLDLANKNGYFNESGVLFTFRRHRAKVKIYYIDKTGNTGINFEGLIDEAATRFGINNKHVNITVSSLDSILAQIPVSGGDIINGDLFSTAIKSILNKTAITQVLNYDAGKINVSTDKTIDDATKFSGLSVKDALNYLLNASNSVLTVDKNNNISVSSRSAGSNIVTFYGASDAFGRDNIIQIYNYNLGYHRLFNSIVVNERETTDSTSITNYGFRQKILTFDFITNTGKIDDIAASILAEYKNPKKELTIKLRSSELQNISLLDEVRLNMSASPYNNIGITTDDRFKIIGITEYPSTFTADILLREI